MNTFFNIFVIKIRFSSNQNIEEGENRVSNFDDKYVEKSVQLVRVSSFRNGLLHNPNMSLFSQIHFLSLFANSWVNLICWTTYFMGKKTERWFLEFVCFSFFHFWLLRRSYWPLNKIMWLLWTNEVSLLEFEKPIRFLRNFSSVNINKVFSARFSTPECIKQLKQSWL